MTQTHALHEGELRLQKLTHTPDELADAIPNYIRTDMPQQHAEFFPGLSYLPLSALDSRGRPWASLLVTKSAEDPSIGITVSGRNQTDVVAETNSYDPFVLALGEEQTSPSMDKRLFAGVGIDYTNRRRNKLAGHIVPTSIGHSGKIRLQLLTDQHLGNCPKYITVRSLEYQPRDAELILDSREDLTTPLPVEAKQCINRASTTYLATKHTAQGDDASQNQCDMGFNHRGGAPGFVRLYERSEGDKVTTFLILPDHSGNRFYQSLGNIETDKQAGMIFPDFTTGDILYITGNAENLHGDDAEEIMPRAGLLTRIEVTGAVLVKAGLKLRLTSDEQCSPYNPPVKYLKSELAEMGRASEAQTSEPIKATLVSAQAHSKSISTFTFQLSSPIEQGLPGGFGGFDFSDLMDTGYRHMDEVNPQMVNEDYIRTWTLSNVPTFDAKKNTFQLTSQIAVTVKRKPGGIMSNFLHENADKLTEQNVQVNFKGAGAGFSCFTSNAQGAAPSVPSKMLWIAGGVGITPFMAMWDGLIQVADANPTSVSSDITLLFSGRDDDISILNHFLDREGSIPKNLKLRILAYQGTGQNPATAHTRFNELQTETSGVACRIEERRVKISDLQGLDDLTDREIFLCGPDNLVHWYNSAFETLSVDQSRLHQELFSF